MTIYIIRSVRGHSIASFDSLERAVQFQKDRKERGVIVRVFRQQIREEEVK